MSKKKVDEAVTPEPDPIPEPKPALTAEELEAARVRALRRAPQEPSTPFRPTWRPPLSLLGQVVLYVMPDGTDRDALIKDLKEDGTAALHVHVALDSDDPVQSRQFVEVPFGAAGEPGTWREAPQ